MSENEAGWEHFETEADVAVRAWAPTRAGAFAQAALGVFALVIRPDGVVEREHREVRAQGDSPERLLVAWINECLYVHAIEGFAVRRVAKIVMMLPPLFMEHDGQASAVRQG